MARPRIGKKKSTRPSTATGKRASKRLVARRKRNGKKGFFPNPLNKYYVADSYNGEGFEYGWDGVTPIGWYVSKGSRIPARGKHGRITYGYLLPLNLTDSSKFKSWIKDHIGKTFSATKRQLQEKFREMM